MSHIGPLWANVLLFPGGIEDIGVEAMREVEERRTVQFTSQNTLSPSWNQNLSFTDLDELCSGFAQEAQPEPRLPLPNALAGQIPKCHPREPMGSGNTELRYTTIDGASALQQPPDREDSQRWGFAAEMPHDSALSFPRGGRNQHCQFSKEFSQEFSATASKNFIAQPALASTSPGNEENDGNKKSTCIKSTSQHEKTSDQQKRHGNLNLDLNAFHLGACDGCATARAKCEKIEKPACQRCKRMKVTCTFSRTVSFKPFPTI